MKNTNSISGDRKLAKQLRMLAALPEDCSSVPSIPQDVSQLPLTQFPKSQIVSASFLLAPVHTCTYLHFDTDLYIIKR